jgi:hypothetical protein
MVLVRKGNLHIVTRVTFWAIFSKCDEQSHLSILFSSQFHKLDWHNLLKIKSKAGCFI